MIKIWKHKYTLLTYDSEPIRFAVNPEQFDIFYQFTITELEQFAKECFEAARENTRIRGYVEPEFKDFATFWAERKEKLNND